MPEHEVESAGFLAQKSRVFNKLEDEGFEPFDVPHDIVDWASPIDAHETDVLDCSGLCWD